MLTECGSVATALVKMGRDQWHLRECCSVAQLVLIWQPPTCEHEKSKLPNSSARARVLQALGGSISSVSDVVAALVLRDAADEFCDAVVDRFDRPRLGRSHPVLHLCEHLLNRMRSGE